MPVVLDRDSAKTFFDGIKAQKQFIPGSPKLSKWLIDEIEVEYLNAYFDDEASSKNPLSQSKDATIKEDESTKPATGLKNQPVHGGS